MADRIPVYVNQSTQQITELSVNDSLDVSTVKAATVETDSLTVNGTPYAPYDDSGVKSDISSNSSAIADNTADIATNAENIATNAGNILTNSGNISANTTAIAGKLDADKIWTGTEAQYNSTQKDSNTLYFITG